MEIKYDDCAHRLAFSSRAALQPPRKAAIHSREPATENTFESSELDI